MKSLLSKSLVCVLFFIACVFALAQHNIGLAQTGLYEFGGANVREDGDDVDCYCTQFCLFFCCSYGDDWRNINGSVGLSDGSYQIFGPSMGQDYQVLSEGGPAQTYDDGSVRIEFLRNTRYNYLSIRKFPDHIEYFGRTTARPRGFADCDQGHLRFRIRIIGRRPARAPSTLRASPVSPSQINLNWQNNTGIGTRIDIERRLSGGWSGLTSVASSATSYEDRNVSDGTQACYRVRTCNNAGACTGYSNESCATTPPCTYSISSTSTPVRPSGGTGSVGVTAAPSGCRWTASSNVSWLTILSGGSGTGNGTVTYSVAANTSSSVRAGALTISGQTFTVAQHGIGGTIYVNRFYTGAELGTQNQPFRTINPANLFAWDGAQIKIRAGSYTEPLRLFKRLTVLADGGPVTIGR